ncbi:hypothetical protein M405DRAFT_935076 [Rhizopogon salebrosus TDB-379]|nr:hypothetical protein M405DRAFT_935076 [Rhizopogon salebrosus TDB-379]
MTLMRQYHSSKGCHGAQDSTAEQPKTSKELIKKEKVAHIGKSDSKGVEDEHMDGPLPPTVPAPPKLESTVLNESNIELTPELHVLRARLLHYQSLLHNFNVSVRFIGKPNPAMEGEELDRRRDMLSDRLKNVLDLASAAVNIKDNRQTQELTKATISYLMIVFLPASFIVSVFGMNFKEINGSGSLATLAHYVETTFHSLSRQLDSLCRHHTSGPQFGSQKGGWFVEARSVADSNSIDVYLRE